MLKCYKCILLTFYLLLEISSLSLFFSSLSPSLFSSPCRGNARNNCLFAQVRSARNFLRRLFTTFSIKMERKDIKACLVPFHRIPLPIAILSGSTLGSPPSITIPSARSRFNGDNRWRQQSREQTARGGFE